ncbi:hypothetical protein LUZ61_011229 [Rhynchospora tenuis]|uniref:Uncharacterized protein n=1 Tax=Rhynchospora tenuis TaxID=198213 RepID=A0AAD6A0K8_9POAL|nr:hypothetical protein LUZ61_011229 [Rhynchospora tenuis]
MVMMGHQFEKLVGGLKSKLRSLKGKKHSNSQDYDKMDKTESMRVEIRSRRAQKLIAKNLVLADNVGRKRFPF